MGNYDICEQLSTLFFSAKSGSVQSKYRANQNVPRNQGSPPIIIEVKNLLSSLYNKFKTRTLLFEDLLLRSELLNNNTLKIEKNNEEKKRTLKSISKKKLN